MKERRKGLTDVLWRAGNFVQGKGQYGGGYDVTCEKARVAAASEEIVRRKREIDNHRKEGAKHVGRFSRDAELLPAYWENLFGPRY